MTFRYFFRTELRDFAKSRSKALALAVVATCSHYYNNALYFPLFAGKPMFLCRSRARYCNFNSIFPPESVKSRPFRSRIAPTREEVQSLKTISATFSNIFFDAERLLITIMYMPMCYLPYFFHYEHRKCFWSLFLNHKIAKCFYWPRTDYQGSRRISTHRQRSRPKTGKWTKINLNRLNKCCIKISILGYRRLALFLASLVPQALLLISTVYCKIATRSVFEPASSWNTSLPANHRQLSFHRSVLMFIAMAIDMNTNSRPSLCSRSIFYFSEKTGLESWNVLSAS